jgi:hypothetical protein
VKNKEDLLPAGIIIMVFDFSVLVIIVAVSILIASSNGISVASSCGASQGLPVERVASFLATKPWYALLDQQAMTDLVLQVEEGTTRTVNYYTCSLNHNGYELDHYGICDSTDVPNSCVTVATFNATVCASTAPCSYLNYYDLLYTADCSGIISTLPNCKVDCGEESGTCIIPPLDHSSETDLLDAEKGATSGVSLTLNAVVTISITTVMLSLIGMI